MILGCDDHMKIKNRILKKDNCASCIKQQMSYKYGQNESWIYKQKCDVDTIEQLLI